MFDYTGSWSEPFGDDGHSVHRLHLADNDDPVNAGDFDVAWFLEERGIEWVDAIIAALPHRFYK